MEKFLTGSSYMGNFNSAVHCMEGYGIYIYPDGSRYSGTFQRGRFHGYGRFQLSPPENFTFVGEFVDGEMKTLSEFIFPDGLHMYITFAGGSVSTKDWLYCTGPDRRLAEEIVAGTLPVNPENPTIPVPLHRIRPHSYDTREGIFVEGTGFVIQRELPFYKERFVGDNKEIEWIRKNCRHGPIATGDNSPIEPDPEFARKIIDVNIAQELKYSSGALYPINIEDKRKIAKEFRKLSAKRKQHFENSTSEDSFVTPQSTGSVTTFSDGTLVAGTNANVDELPKPNEDKYGNKSNLERQ